MIDAETLAYEYDEEGRGFGEPPQAGRPRSGAATTALLALGTAAFVAVSAGAFGLRGTWAGLLLGFGPLAAGAIAAFAGRYHGTARGIRNDGVAFAGTTARGWPAWTLAVLLTGFYLALYLQPEVTALAGVDVLAGPVAVTDPLARLLAGRPADRWFCYGFLYTLSVLVLGVRMLYRYRHDRYQVVRTGSLMFFQLGFAFLIPNVLAALEQPEFYASYFWPLKAEYLFPDDVGALLRHPGGLGAFMVAWGAVMTFVATPVLTYFFGKRWYCSWVCGCGALAETLGDPWRRLSSKSGRAWRIERALIYSVLGAVTALTACLWLWPSSFSYGFKKAYGFAIASMFAGVIGVGFYPLLGARVWCRFGCPLAAILGVLQRVFSRFRITTNGGQCMSCGNCSAFCEMGIDVRAYAQRGEAIVRAACVGCGVCSAVCPRGVLRLENGKTHDDRYDGADTPIDRALRDLREPAGTAP